MFKKNITFKNNHLFDKFIEIDKISKLSKDQEVILIVTTSPKPIEVYNNIIKNEDFKNCDSDSIRYIILSLYPSADADSIVNVSNNTSFLHLPTFQIINKKCFCKHIKLLERYKYFLVRKKHLSYYEPIKLENLYGIWVTISFLFHVRAFLFNNKIYLNLKKVYISTSNVRSGYFLFTYLKRYISKHYKFTSIFYEKFYFFSFLRDVSHQLILSLFQILKVLIHSSNSQFLLSSKNVCFIQIESNSKIRLDLRLSTLLASDYKNYTPYFFSISQKQSFFYINNRKIKLNNVLRIKYHAIFLSLYNIIKNYSLDIFSGSLIIPSLYYNFLNEYLKYNTVDKKFISSLKSLDRPLLSLWGDTMLSEGDLFARSYNLNSLDLKFLSLSSRTFYWIDYISNLYINKLYFISSSPDMNEFIANNKLFNLNYLPYKNSMNKNLYSYNKQLNYNKNKLVIIDLPNYESHPIWINFIELNNFTLLIRELQKDKSILILIKPHPSFKSLSYFLSSYKFLSTPHSSIVLKEPLSNIEDIILHYKNYNKFFVTRNSTLFTKFQSQDISCFILSNDFLQIQSVAFGNDVSISNNIYHIINRINV